MDVTSTVMIERGLSALGLAAARTMPLCWWVPALGGTAVPAPVRIALGLALAILCLPKVAAAVPSAGSLAWLFLGMREVAVGLTLAFVATCVFRAIEAAGRLIDILRGANLAEVLVPGAEERTSPMGGLYLLLAAVVFLELGGLPRMVAAVGASYERVPIQMTMGELQLGRVLSVAILASAGLFVDAVGFAAPVLVAMLLADAALGVLGRAAPQLPLYFLGLPAKAMLGVGVVLLALGATSAALSGEIVELLRSFDRVLAAWR